MSAAQRDRLAREVLDEVFGLGPLEPLLQDPAVSDILVNSYKHVYVERSGHHGRNHRQVQRRRPPDAHHRKDCRRGRPPRRRIFADGGCAPGRWLAHQRHYSAALAIDGPALVRPAFWRVTPLVADDLHRQPNAHRSDDGDFTRSGSCAAEYVDFRGHRIREKQRS